MVRDFLFISVLGLVGGCVSPDEAGQKTSDPIVEDAEVIFSPAEVKECIDKWSKMTCDSSQAAPTFCVYDRGKTIAARGGNPCLAKLRLQQRLCARLSLADPVEMDCRPDASAGNCPPRPGVCSSQMQPAACTAFSYEGVEVAKPDQLKATASNSCLARFKLEEIACDLNLNPRKLGNIECRPGAAL